MQRLGVCALLAVLGLGCGDAAPAPTAQGPDLVLVTLDTVRCDHLGIHGSRLGLSPSLDRLARTGLVHESAYTTMPTTGPAHLSMLTGLHPSQHGSRRNGEPLGPVGAARELGLRLREAGYRTAAFVTTPLLARRATGLAGFDHYDEPDGLLRSGRRAAEDALVWLAAEPARPVFLWLHLYDAHSPYGSATQKRARLPLDPARHGFVGAAALADASERARVAQRYARGVADADAALGVLAAGLAGLLDAPPLWIVTGDHGEALDEWLEARGYAYDHGEFLDEEQVCVPLVVAGPGVAPGRSTSAASVRDVYTTLLAAAGLADPDASSEGRLDLRRARDARRIVLVERKRVGAAAPALVRAHAAAAFDGEQGVIVGDAAAEPPGAAGEPVDLLEAARRHRDGADDRGPRAADPGLREALEALGYAR